jgi:hypothetical protein
VTWGADFVRWVMIVIIAITVMHLFGVIDFKALLSLFSELDNISFQKKI